MSAFEDDVEPAEDMQSRGGTPFGGSGWGKKEGKGKQSSQQQQQLLGKHGREEESPEPDEELDMTNGKQTMWLVKVPRFLLQGWMKVDEEDRPLGSVRVYDADHRGHNRMELSLPDEPEPAFPLPPSHPYLQTKYPRKYDMRLSGEQGSSRVKNLYAFKERMEGGEDDDDDLSGLSDDDDDDKDIALRAADKGKGGIGRIGRDGKRKGRRVVSMVGAIVNEAALKPKMSTGPGFLTNGSSSSSASGGITPEYREVLRKRRLEASRPKHSVKILDESDVSRRNMLSSGVGSGFTKAPKVSLIPSKANQKKGSGSTEKFARMPRNELLDMLFEAFEEYPYWSIKGLRSRVQQPEVYLREVLMSIADYHRVGPYASLWSLKAEYAAMRKRGALQSASVPGGSGSGPSKGPNEGSNHDEDEDEDDEGGNGHDGA